MWKRGTDLMRRVAPVRSHGNDTSEVVGEDAVPRVETGVHVGAAAEESAYGLFPRRILSKVVIQNKGLAFQKGTGNKTYLVGDFSKG